MEKKFQKNKGCLMGQEIKSCKYRECEEERFILHADYDWWSVEDTLKEFRGEYIPWIDQQDVVDLLNKWDKENRELKRDNKILHEVMDTDINRTVQSIIKFHDEIKEQRKYFDRVRFERNTLKKWYLSLNTGYTPAFSGKEFDYLRELDEKRKKIQKKQP